MSESRQRRGPNAAPAEDRAPSRDSSNGYPSEVTIWNIPNLLCLARLVGSIGLVGLALDQRLDAFIALLLFLLLTDWLDGKLAVWLQQQTTFGARLDSAADAAMYGALLWGGIWLKTDFVRDQAPWIAVALSSYALMLITSWLKFGQPPSYHTRAAKISWLVVGFASIMVFVAEARLLFQVAMTLLLLANLEALAITLVLSEPRVNVSSLYHALTAKHSK